ncbi:MAG: transglutaminase-like domain-containing protein [Thermoanaerobaculia bacterium]|nr:transglutaminase-like domain-containing protein [Thermoanaerobaculia bacterium]
MSESASAGIRPGRRRWIGAVIVALWLLSVGLLLRREFGGTAFRNGPDLTALEGNVAYAVLVPGTAGAEQRVGAIGMVREPEARGGFQGTTVRIEAAMALELLGKPTELDVDGAMWRPDAPEEAARQAELEFRVDSQGHEFQLVGELAGGRLIGEVRSAGETLPLDLPVGGDVLVESGLGASLRFPRMEVGETMRFSSFDPLTLSRGRAKVTCVGEETLDLAGQKVEAKRLQVEASGIETVAWIDESGTVLRAETPLGLILERLPAGVPIEGSTRIETADFLGQTAIHPTGLKPSRGAHRMVLRLSGVELEPPFDNAQQPIGGPTGDGIVIEISRDAVANAKTASRPAQVHLSADAFVQSDHAEIRERARRIVGEETDPWRRAQMLHDWVFERIEKEPVVSIPSALEVLRERRGDCNEHTVLYAALARSLGIPTRIAIGLVWSDELDGFYYHAWPEIFLEGDGGRWVRTDPTLGQAIADATHLKLLEGGIESWPRLLAYLGKLQVEVLETDSTQDTTP